MHKLPRFSPHNGGENLRPAIIHYKADMSHDAYDPFLDTIVTITPCLINLGDVATCITEKDCACP